MPSVTVGEVDLEYYVEGVGPPLLMIMGLGGQAQSWGEPFLEQLRPHFRLIRFSNRGTGLSDKPSGDLTVRLMADDAAALLRELDVPRAHVLGISMGGMIAQELALNHPQAVQGLALGCTHCGQTRGPAISPQALGRMGQIGQMPLEQRAREFWLMAVTPEFAEKSQAFLDELMRLHLEQPTPWETFGRQFMAIQRFDTYDRLPQLKAPTLIIHGDHDVLVPVANADILHDRIPGSKVHIVPGVGHCFFWEKPAESARAIADFLSAVPAPA